MIRTDKILQQKIARIKKVFNVEQIRSLKTDDNYVKRYYKVNQLTYSLFHTLSDRMYMGVSRDGVYKPSDLLEAARVVEKYSKKLKAKRVLEIATGRGATSAYLAEKYPDMIFDGIDISPGQLYFAYKKARRFTNYHPREGDYHDLSTYPSNNFDIVFEIEAVCYSQRKEKVFLEVNRVLKKGGVFILLDGYLAVPRPKLTGEELLATQITEKGMAVPEFELYTEVLGIAKKTGFSVLESEDVSQYIMSTLKRFARISKIFFAIPPLARATVKVLPLPATANTIAGYLMPDFIRLNLGCYYITVLRKD